MRRLVVLGGIHEGRATLDLEIVEIKGAWLRAFDTGLGYFWTEPDVCFGGSGRRGALC